MKKQNKPSEIHIPHDGSYFAVKGKMESAEFAALLQKEVGITVDALKVEQAYVKAVPDEECGSVLCKVKEGTRGAFWMTFCESSDTKQVGKLDQGVQKDLLAMETKTTTARISEIIEHKDKDFCPLPIGIIPDQMGINLCCVKDITWTQQEDGQITNITINFTPNPNGVPQAGEEETHGKTIKASRR